MQNMPYMPPPQGVSHQNIPHQTMPPTSHLPPPQQQLGTNNPMPTTNLSHQPQGSSPSQSLAIDQMAQLATLLNANKQSSGVSTAQHIATLLAQQQQQQLSSQPPPQTSDPRSYQSSPYVSQNKYNY